MKGYLSKSCQDLIEKRSKIISQIEVINMELHSLNKQIGEELVNSVGNKLIVFDERNKVTYTIKNKTHHSVDSSTLYHVVEIRSANTQKEIVYTLEDEQGERITITQDNFHSFKIS